MVAPLKQKAFPQKKGDMIMTETAANEAIMKAACIQAAAASVSTGRHDALAIVKEAKKIMEEMEKQGYFPGQ